MCTHWEKQILILNKNIADENNTKSSYTKRSLLGSLDPAKSEVTGLGVTSPLLVSTNYDILVTARDSLGARITTGGERVFISITDHCTRTAKMTCSRVAASPSVLASPVHAQMTDNGDGTYSYSVNIGSPGRVTIAVIVVHKIGIQEEYFDNTSLTGPVVKTNIVNMINYNWGFGLITPTLGDFVSIKFNSKLTSCETTSYDFAITHDDGAILDIDGVRKVSSWYNAHQTSLFTLTMNAFETYDMYLEWYDNTGSAILVLKWRQGTSSFMVIPEEIFAVAKDIQLSPYQIEVIANCPSGYTKGDGINSV